MMRIEVLPEDINEGVPGSSTKCPVARAVQRYAGGWVLADYWGICLAATPPKELSVTDPALKVLDTPDIVSRLMAEFDNSGRMDPFGFEL